MSSNVVTPLHVRSGYSLVRGTALPASIIERACRLGHRRLALTDVNGLYGATGFYKLALKAGLEPIIGAELQDGNTSAVALVAGRAGYENLCRIITRIHCRSAADKAASCDAKQPDAGAGSRAGERTGADGGGDPARLRRRPAKPSLVGDLLELS